MRRARPRRRDPAPPAQADASAAKEPGSQGAPRLGGAGSDACWLAFDGPPPQALRPLGETWHAQGGRLAARRQNPTSKRKVGYGLSGDLSRGSNVAKHRKFPWLLTPAPTTNPAQRHGVATCEERSRRMRDGHMHSCITELCTTSSALSSSGPLRKCRYILPEWPRDGTQRHPRRDLSTGPENRAATD